MKPTQLNAGNFKYSHFQLIFVVCLVLKEWLGLKVQGQFQHRFQDSMFSTEEEQETAHQKIYCSN